MSTDATQGDGGSRVVGRVVEFVGQVLIPAGVLTAVLYYFGYVREQALFSYFGVDLGSVELTTTDYVVRSAGAVFAPLARVWLVGVVALVAHHLVVAVLRSADPRWWRLVWSALALIAVALLSVGAVGLQFPFTLVSPLVASVALGSGAVLLEYATWMAGGDDRLRAEWRATATAMMWPRRALLLGVALVAAFWLTANVAHRNGIETAHAIELSLATRAEAVVYSTQRLQISGPGVDVAVLDDADSAFAYQYAGLRVLVHSGGRWFLIPAGWRHDNEATVVLLPDDTDDVRVDLRP
jgi:hypothetical protein